MGERVSDEITMGAAPEVVWRVITDFEDYPNWAEGMERAEVLERDEQGRPTRARFEVDAKVFQVTYTLAYTHDDEALTWTLVEGDKLTQLDGEYRVTPEGEGCRVRYTLEADFDMPLPAFLKKRGAKRILDTGLKELKQQAEARV